MPGWWLNCWHVLQFIFVHWNGHDLFSFIPPPPSTHFRTGGIEWNTNWGFNWICGAVRGLVIAQFSPPHNSQPEKNTWWQWVAAQLTGRQIPLFISPTNFHYVRWAHNLGQSATSFALLYLDFVKLSRRFSSGKSLWRREKTAKRGEWLANNINRSS